MKEHTTWVKAAADLIRNPYAQILCPSCGLAFLTVEDEQLDEQHIDRHLKCPNCGAHETVLKKTPNETSRSSDES